MAVHCERRKYRPQWLVARRGASYRVVSCRTRVFAVHEEGGRDAGETVDVHEVSCHLAHAPVARLEVRPQPVGPVAFVPAEKSRVEDVVGEVGSN